jgi:hypothetical protein
MRLMREFILAVRPEVQEAAAKEILTPNLTPLYPEVSNVSNMS